MGVSLAPRCPVCKSKEKLLKCQGCKVTLYCGRDHQASDRPTHKTACNAVKKAQQNMDTEETKLRAHPGDMWTPNGDRIFEDHAGHFWGLVETRPYVNNPTSNHTLGLNTKADCYILDAISIWC